MTHIEEDFNDPNVRHDHYLRHVAVDQGTFINSLSPNNQGYIDPLLPPMSEIDYENEANILANSPAGDSNDKTSRIIGFQIKAPDGRIRNVKFRKTSKFINYNNPTTRHAMHGVKFLDCVIYVIENNKPVVISFMASKTNKIFRLKRQFYSELPENQPQNSSLTVSEALHVLKNL